ncbi:MAG TPA: hypothetical protein PLT32_00775 [bacterium]|nr:hypothetical protein [bacterium]
MRLKNLSSSDLPREKLEKYGQDRLKDSELLAILLGVGSKGTNVVELSKKLLTKWKGKDFCSVTLNELTEINGVGKAKACEIVACFELGRRFLKDKTLFKQFKIFRKYNSAQELVSIVKSFPLIQDFSIADEAKILKRFEKDATITSDPFILVANKIKGGK